MNKEPVQIIVCRSQDFHPYECDGFGHCIHCDRKSTKDHRVSKCALCQETKPIRKKRRKK